MSVKDKLPEITEYFTNSARLFVAVMRDTNADTMKQSTTITHFESGDKYEVKLVLKKI